MKKIRYFHYISSTKVNPAYDQINSTSGPLQFKAAVNAGPVQLEASRGGNTEPSLVAKLLAVERFIRKNDKLGTIDKPSRWIEGREWAMIRCIKDARGAVFYFLRTENTYLALGGSSGNLVSGFSNRSENFGVSFAADLVDTLLSLEKLPPDFLPDEEELGDYLESGIAGDDLWEGIIYDQCHYRQRRTFDTHITFIAKKIKCSTYRGKTILLGSPLFVEQTD